MRRIRVVTIGGGTGHSVLLEALRTLFTNTTAVCTASDSGGFTGRLLSHYKFLNGSIGDVSKCVLALSSNRELAQDLSFRFQSGFLSGISLKNIFLAGLILKHGSMEGLRKFWNYADLAKNHRVYPITWDRVQLRAHLPKRVITGESNIDKLSHSSLWDPTVHKIQRVSIQKRAQAIEEVIEAIKEADLILLSPGDLFTSLLPVSLAQGVRQAILESTGKVVYFLPLMTKAGETDGYSASLFLAEVKKYFGRVDIVVANSAQVPKELLRVYGKKESKTQTPLDLEEGNGLELILADLVGVDQKGRVVHDPKKLASVVKRLSIK